MDDVTLERIPDQQELTTAILSDGNDDSTERDDDIDNVIDIC